MKTEITQTKSYQKKVSFVLDTNEMQEQYKKSFNSFKKKASIKGFRKGKAPLSIVESMHGKSIEGQSIDDAINESYKKFLMESKIFPLAQASIENVDYKKEEGLKFDALLEVHPEIELGKYTTLKVEKLKVNITEEELTSAIDKTRNDFATKRAIDTPIVKGNVVKIKLRPESLADQEWEEKTVEVGQNAEDIMDEKIIGLKAGEEKVLEFDQGEDDNKMKIEVRVKIESVEEKILPELTDEFVKTIDKKFENIEAFTDEIKKNLSLQKEEHSTSTMLNMLIEKIIDENGTFEVPPSILEGYLKDMVENAKKQYGQVGITDEILRNIYSETATKTVKWEYIKQAILKKAEIKIEKEDTEKYFENVAKKANITIEQLKSFYKAPDKKNILNQNILEEKLNKFLEENNEIVEVEELSKPETEEKEIDAEKEISEKE